MTNRACFGVQVLQHTQVTRGTRTETLQWLANRSAAEGGDASCDAATTVVQQAGEGPLSSEVVQQAMQAAERAATAST